MVPKVVRVAVKYSKPGIQPPVYIAGSFSDPAWQPQEMQHTINENGDYEYTKEIQIEEGKEYQYKYRIGSGEWWLLSEDSPTGMATPARLGERLVANVLSVFRSNGC
jgi:hypothetical protein